MLHPYRPTAGNHVRHGVVRTKNWTNAVRILFVIGFMGIFVTMDVIHKSMLSNTNHTRSLGCTVRGVLPSHLLSTSMGRSLCQVETVLESESFETAFGDNGQQYDTADYDTTRPSGDVAFVLTLPDCFSEGTPFYDAVAVLRDSVCNCTARNDASGSNYDATMYAIVHPDAIHCSSNDEAASNTRRLVDNGTTTYDRVAILEELGFWVMIWREPLSVSDLSPGLQSQLVNDDSSLRDLMRLYAYNLTSHPVAVLMDLDTIFLQNIDSIVDPFLADSNPKALYTTTGNSGSSSNGGMVQMGSLYIKPDESELVDILNLYQNTPYDTTTGWDNSNIVGVTTDAILSYRFQQDSTAYVNSAESISNAVISFASNPDCGLPWMCHYNESWDNATMNECRHYHSSWFQYRQSFESRWSKTDIVNRSDVDFHNDFFLGYCTSFGEDGYPTAADYGIVAEDNGYLTQDDFMTAGQGVSFVSDGKEFLLESSSSSSSDFGVILSAHAYNANELDFVVNYTQTSFTDLQDGYEPQLVFFLIETGTYPETLLQSDNQFGEFEDLTAVFMKSKVHTDINTLNYTFISSRVMNSATQLGGDHAKYLQLSMRLTRVNNTIVTYWSPDGEWVQIGTATPLPGFLHDVPLQVGVRVKNEWRPYHRFQGTIQKVAGGPPLAIPTASPTLSPTETSTPIVRRTTYKEPVCPSTLDQSSWDPYPYEVRGVGGGGAMSGLSISPWNDLWFVGTDMGTLFRSTDAGRLWYPVSHYEAKFHSQLPVSAPVGFATSPTIVVHATCHPEVATRDCVAQRSVDSGVTWNPINVTGGSRVDRYGNSALESIPKQWTGSLVPNSGILYVTMFGTGMVYRSNDDGATWSSVSSLPHNTSNEAVGLYLDESALPERYVYFATTQEIIMWKEGEESQARTVWTSDGTALLQSFTGARSSSNGKLTLAFVDSNATACNDEGAITNNCGFVHIFSEVDTAATAYTTGYNFDFLQTTQHGFRVASSPTDAELLYVTGQRRWPSSTGTKVWKGIPSGSTGEFSFSLTFRQYPRWDDLDYSGVGLDVGYWDGGYYTWGMNPNNSSVAGGSGNFFLHVTRNAGEHWESPFTEYADGCNTNDVRLEGRRWRSTGLEMTSVRTIQFNPYNTSYAFASVADIRMLRSDDGGKTFEITGGDNTDPLWRLNTVYDYDFYDKDTVFGVGGNFHDWPHGWYKNLIRGAGGVYVSFNSGDNWHRVGSEASMNCDPAFKDVDCSLGDDMVRQILSVLWDNTTSTLYVGTHAAGVARLQGLNFSGTIEEMQDLQWEWINTGLGTEAGRIVPELKQRNGNIYCLLTGNSPHWNNTDSVGIYQLDAGGDSWTHKRGTVHRHSAIEARFDLWAYATSFDISEVDGTMWLTDMEANWNYLASGVWKSTDDGVNWHRMQQFTFPYHIMVTDTNRVYASGARSISHIGNAGWGDGGAFYSDDSGQTWQKNEAIPLLSNLNSATVDPHNASNLFYTFFGGGMMHGPQP